ncbi:MAG TPA: bifunctional shikimate kinase/3-dehydroquinate synthase [Candidatus Limnocylindrales bacterium]|nr:bifunctional shikimate kinase/3-dehydroquinate synthase [Candidatus Limnocylindrales bacterium]
MDVVLIGLPGSGKSAVGRRLAARHGASFTDLDEVIEREAGVRIPEIFADEGEAGFRARERAVVAALGPPDPQPAIRRVIAPGGGAIVDPRNRWRLYRGRVPIWLDARPEVLAQRLRRSPTVRPLIVGRDPIRALRELTAARGRFYGAATRIAGMAEVHGVVDAVDRAVAEAAAAPGTTLVRAETTLGRLSIGEGIAGRIVGEELARLGAGRAIVVSEPGAWGAVGPALERALGAAGLPIELVLLPQGEAAKTLGTIEAAARELARRRVERGEALVAVGGGALGDAAGFLAATYLRGIPFIQVPTTLVAQIDSSIGGKTGVDLPEGKNLVGAFHQPVAIVIDVALLATLPERERRAALGEAVKMAALGDERWFELLEARGAALASGDPAAFEDGALAEVVERCAWAKIEVVAADEKETAVRVALNLGHSLGHAFEAAGGYADLRHGEAVAFGLRAACRIGVAAGVTPPERAARVERALDAVGLGAGVLPYALDAVLDHLGSDKKHRGGRLRWVLPTEAGSVVRDDVDPVLVRDIAAGLLAPMAVGGAV